MIINHNISALNTLNKLTTNSKNTAKVMQKLSSGLRINQASDDSAGLAISEKMRAQIRGLQQAQRNIQDGISLIQTAESGLGDIANQLQRARELSVQSANDTLTHEDRLQIQKEVQQIKDGINEIANNTAFNGINLLKGLSGTVQTPINLSFSSINTGTNESLFGVASNGSQYVIDGGNGTLKTSNDNGTTWSDHTLSSGDGLTDVTWDGSKYVAVGTSGRIITSTDGSSWFNRISGTSYQLEGLDISGNKYVAVGQSGTILTSVDSTSWTSQSSGTTNWLKNVTSGAGKYVAVGDNGTILTSNDGSSWTTQSTGTTNSLLDISYNGNKFVAVGTNGTIMTSNDGTSWTTQSSNTTNFLSGVTWTGNEYVAVGGNGTIITSSNGTSWTSQISGTTNTLREVKWYGNQVMAVGDNGEMIVASTNSNKNANTPTRDLQIGANTGDTFKVELTDARTETLGIDDVDLSTRQGAESVISKIDKALETVSSERSKFGAYQNALEHIHNNASNYETNLTASESRIRGTDMAKQMMVLTKNQILSQASQAMLTQSVQQPQQVLQLLK